METGILLFFQSQQRIKGTNLFSSSHIFILPSEVLSGPCLKKKKATNLLIFLPSSILKIESGPLKVGSYQVVIQLPSASVSWALAKW